jgi:hypothetical protein
MCRSKAKIFSDHPFDESMPQIPHRRHTVNPSVLRIAKADFNVMLPLSPSKRLTVGPLTPANTANCFCVSFCALRRFIASSTRLDQSS